MSQVITWIGAHINSVAHIASYIILKDFLKIRDLTSLLNSAFSKLDCRLQKYRDRFLMCSFWLNYPTKNCSICVRYFRPQISFVFCLKTVSPAWNCVIFLCLSDTNYWFSRLDERNSDFLSNYRTLEHFRLWESLKMKRAHSEICNKTEDKNSLVSGNQIFKEKIPTNGARYKEQSL